jgi:SAM-dependent methyltransferase
MDATPPDAWLQQAACADLRDAAEHVAERPLGAVSLEVDDLLYRPYLLPPRSQPLVLVGGPPERMPLVVRALRAAGHADVRHLPASVWRAHLEAESGPPTRTRLWEPSPALVEALGSHPLPPGSTALDLACGAGRNAVYLALCGFEVTAVDILPDALARVNELALHSAVHVNCVQRNLEFPGALDDLRADLVVVVRFLDRALFGPLQRTVRPGGLLVYETFTVDQAESGHPRNPKFLLEPDELRRAFPDLRTILCREGFFDGAYLARLVAVAPGPGST